MLASTDRAPLKVLNTGLADRLRVFNAAARTLQGKGIRLQRIDPVANLLVVSPEDGSTRYTVTFMGVTLEWREPISYRDFKPVAPTFH